MTLDRWSTSILSSRSLYCSSWTFFSFRSAVRSRCLSSDSSLTECTSPCRTDTANLSSCSSATVSCLEETSWLIPSFSFPILRSLLVSFEYSSWRTASFSSSVEARECFNSSISWSRALFDCSNTLSAVWIDSLCCMSSVILASNSDCNFWFSAPSFSSTDCSFNATSNSSILLSFDEVSSTTDLHLSFSSLKLSSSFSFVSVRILIWLICVCIRVWSCLTFNERILIFLFLPEIAPCWFCWWFCTNRFTSAVSRSHSISLDSKSLIVARSIDNTASFSWAELLRDELVACRSFNSLHRTWILSVAFRSSLSTSLWTFSKFWIRSFLSLCMLDMTRVSSSTLPNRVCLSAWSLSFTVLQWSWIFWSNLYFWTTFWHSSFDRWATLRTLSRSSLKCPNWE